MLIAASLNTTHVRRLCFNLTNYIWANEIDWHYIKE